MSIYASQKQFYWKWKDIHITQYFCRICGQAILVYYRSFYLFFYYLFHSLPDCLLDLKYTMEKNVDEIYSQKQTLKEHHLPPSSTDNDSCRDDIVHNRYGEFIKVCRYQRGNQKTLI